MRGKIYLSEKDITDLQGTGNIEITGENGVRLKICKGGNGCHRITARVGGEIVGLIETDYDSHDIIKVRADFRKMGIGELIWNLKTSLDGFRRFEWSKTYSRIRFLVRHGYYPIGTSESIGGHSIPLSKEERRKLGATIQHLPENDEADRVYYFKRAPIRALLLRKYLKKS